MDHKGKSHRLQRIHHIGPDGESVDKLTRTPRGRLEAFNAQSKLSDELRILLKLVDGKRDLADLKKALKPHICTPERIQTLIDMGLIVKSISARDADCRPTFNAHAYSPTEPAALAALEISAQKVFAVESDDIADADADILLRAKECMGDFVLRYAPQSAVYILVEIETFQSIEQLEASLMAYEQLIAQTGTFATNHLRELRGILGFAYA